MVNAPAPEKKPDRRERSRNGASHQGVLGPAKLNPFGDLHTLQHLSARLARGIRSVFEPLLREEVRCWAEPLAVQRFADYRAERSDGLTAWLPMAMTTAGSIAHGQALCVLDGMLVLELLDLFFGGTGAAPAVMPREFSPAGEAMVARIGAMIEAPLRATWEPLAKIDFTRGHCESNPAMLADIDGDDAVIVTRFGIAAGTGRPVFVDLLYSVAALKPHGASLTGKVVGKSAEPDPAWQTGLTRAAMNVRFAIWSVLAEPVVPLSLLMNLKPGDVIPISFGADVPIMVGNDRLGSGTVGTSNGHAAIQITQFARIDEGQMQ